MKEKDLIILSMSTLPSLDKLVENDYVDKETGKKYNGVSQLEPGTECFIDELKSKNLTHIYIINSQKTRNPLSKDVLDKIIDCDYLKKEQINKNKANINTVQFFIERIRKYVYDSKIDFDQIDQDDFFVPINMDDENDEKKDTFLYDTIYELCSKIRKQTAGGYNIHLFINMVGGKRNDTSIINAVIKMLAIDHINVEKSNTVDFKGNGNTSYILNTTVSDRILEMVSGMDEFIYTGRGDQLKSFWLDSEYLPGKKLSNKENDIINQIVDISNSISLCDVENFKENLANLGSMLKSYGDLPDGEKNPLFNSFVTTLQNDYDKYDLLVENGPKTIDQINWCISKQLYQQALTLVESKMPDDIVNNWIIHYGNGEDLKNFLHEYANEDNNVYIKEKVQGKNHRHTIHIPPYLLRNKDVIEGKEQFVFIKHLFNQSNSTDVMPGYIGKEIITSNITCSSSGMPLFRPYKNADGQREDYNFPENIPGSDKIFELLKTYFILAEMRNEVNHGNGDKLILVLDNKPDKVQTVQGELVNFIEKYRDIERHHYHIDYSDFVTIHNFSPEILNSKKEAKTFRGLPKSEQNINDFLKNIWTDHYDVIEDFQVINHAILQMDGLTWEEFKGGEYTEYATLNMLLDYMISDSPNVTDKEESKKRRFEQKKGQKPPYERFIHSVQNIRGFYPDNFFRIEGNKL